MMHLRAAHSLFLGVTMLAACARGDTGATDTAGSSGPTAAAAPGAETGRPAPQSPEHDFLRRMIDHHEGLIQMATTAMSKASTSATQGDAHNLHTKQAEEQKKMIADVQAQYNEVVTPMVMPQHKAMVDSLATKTGAEYDRTFYRLTIEHHREAVRMVDEMLPRFTKADVKAMAEKMKSDQQREISAFERKARA
ncbi:MAG TPA: DUF305 domain-containing protein [Gemmatimonadaceae bacterium]|nr:DUF305 domain-containing protein [Gemmatimonadaceae bacterium]